MTSKYKQAISEIVVTDDVKNKIIDEMIKEKIEIQENLIKNGCLFIKLKRIATICLSVLGILLGCIAIISVLWSKIDGITIFEKISNLFSGEEYSDLENVKNQIIEKDGTILKLESTICDNSWIIMQFDLSVNEDLKAEPDIIYFNGDNPLNNNGTLIIDGDEFAVNQRINQKIKKYEDNKFKVYQIYFLTEKELQGKTQFKIDFDRIIIEFSDTNNYKDSMDLMTTQEDTVIKFDGKFEANLSKYKATAKYNKIKCNLSQIEDKNIVQNMEDITITPEYNILRLTTTYNDINKNSIENIRYEIFNQNEKEIITYNYKVKNTIIYADGTREGLNLDEFDEIISEDKDEEEKLTVEVEEYILFEKSDELTTLRIEVYDDDKYIGEYLVNFNKKEKGFGKDYVFLYYGCELKKQTGLQTVSKMPITDSERYNIRFYNYQDGKYAGDFKGNFGTNIDKGYSYVDNANKIAVSKEYEIYPRKISKIYTYLEENFDKIPSTFDELKNQYTTIEVRVCDLDGDGKEEYIMAGFKKYKDGKEPYSVISLYNSKQEKICDLAKEYGTWDMKNGSQDDIENATGWLNIDKISECVDIDNDGIMEIIVNLPSEEEYKISIVKYNQGVVEGETNINIDKYFNK